jgi:hypothetical protein
MNKRIAVQLVDELNGTLLEEIEAYQYLLELQQAEKRLLVARTLEPFLANLQAKDRVIQTLTRLENKRQTVLCQLAPGLHLSKAAVTLRQLSTRVPEPYASTFLQHRERLQQLVTALQRCTRENARLLQDALAFIDDALAFFACLVPATPTYHPSGTFALPTQGRLLSGRV